MVNTPSALVCNKAPPVNAEYHLNVLGMVLLALSAAILPAQFDPEITEGGAGRGLIVATTGVRGLLSQAPLLKVTKKVVVADNEEVV